MQKILSVAVIFLGLFVSQASAGSFVPPSYKAGWTHQNFYTAVSGCRAAIITPQFAAYEQRGVEDALDRDRLKNELIAISPLLDDIATDTCFCAFNEIAKEVSFSAFQAGGDMKKYLSAPVCTQAMQAKLQEARSLAENLRLK